MTALLKYDIALQAVADAKTIDDVTDWLDKAAAVREYGRRIKDRKLELDALVIRANAKRRRGELIIELKEQGHFPEGRPKETVNRDEQFSPMRLEDYEITRAESHEEQEIARLPGDAFERLVTRCRAYAEAHPEKHSINVLKPPPDGPINGARSVMGSRQEPDDSLDYFPTPPWATRALMERVFPVLGMEPDLHKIQSIWEPACGEGHIAEVLKEYADLVIATDIFDYGYGQAPLNFLKDVPHDMVADWIITNAPFGDNAIKFVDRALALANIGVAMFFRSQWAVEGIERYEQIFRDRPPTLCAFFVERVNLCKGRWEPEGSTATAYCWLVWKLGASQRPPFWIPPGCREALTRPDDVERFTAHPVIKREREIVDPETGEITKTDSPIVTDSTAADTRSVRA